MPKIENKTTVRDIVLELNMLNKERDDYEKALRALVSKDNWQSEIGKNKQQAFITIHALYEEKEKVINELLDKEVM